jgi:Holliday junction resolvase RusA-like endonuclease
MIQLEIDCDPLPWSAPKKGKNGFFDIKYEHKNFARWQLKSQFRDQPLLGKISLEFEFHMKIPKATPKSTRRQMLDRRIRPTSPDCTNMQKLYEDCLQGIVIENDRQVDKISSIRYYSEHPRVVIRVKRWEEEVGYYTKEVKNDQ